MKKPFSIIILLIVLKCHCFGQNFQLDLKFKPSFISSSELKMCQNKDSSYIKFNCKSYDIKEVTNVDTNAFITLKHFFKFYKFRCKGSTDTIGPSYVDPSTGDSVTPCTIGFDGITILGEYRVLNSDKRFCFWSPKDKTSNDSLIRIINDISFSYFSTNTCRYFENLKDYFHFNLNLDTISIRHHHFKLSGIITSHEAFQLFKFFLSLPTNKSVTIDMSDYKGTYNFPLDFYLIVSNNRKLIWINCSVNAQSDLKSIGISEKQIKIGANTRLAFRRVKARKND